MDNHNHTRFDGDGHSNNNETVYEIACLQGMSFFFCQLLYGFDIDALFVKAMTLIAKLSGNHS